VQQPRATGVIGLYGPGGQSSPAHGIEGDAQMRRFMVLSLASLLALALAAPVAAGSHVTNRSGSFDEAYGSWSAYDTATDISTYGNVYVYQESGQPGLVESLYEETGQYVDCAAGGAAAAAKPYDTTGGDVGFQGTRTSGYGNATLTLGRKLAGATASGTIYVETATVDDCAGTYDVVSSGNVQLRLELTGTGPISTFSSKSSVKIPGALKAHSSYRGESRAAIGSVTFGQGPRSLSGDAQIAHVTWTDHCSGTSC
jgi:hypothetical protein